MMLVEIGIQECYAYEIISHIIKSLLLANNSIPGPDRLEERTPRGTNRTRAGRNLKLIGLGGSYLRKRRKKIVACRLRTTL